MKRLAEALKHACSWSIEVNDRRICYRTIPEEFALQREIGNDEYTTELEAECLKTGEIWVFYVCPDTPIGSYTFVAATWSDLEARALDWATSYPWSARPHITP